MVAKAIGNHMVAYFLKYPSHTVPTVLASSYSVLQTLYKRIIPYIRILWEAIYNNRAKPDDKCHYNKYYAQLATT